MRRFVTTAVLAAALAFTVPAESQVTDISAEIISGASDCTTRDRELNSTDGFRFLFRCINGGIKQFALGFITVDANGIPDQFQEVAADAIEDTIEQYADLGWGVTTATGMVDPNVVEYNSSITVYIFYKNTCEPTNCTVPGDDPGTAFLSVPVIADLTNLFRLLPLGPEQDCYYPDTNTTEPCWSYIDCNDVKHYAGCTADGAVTGYTPALPPCDECPAAVSLEQSSWGRIKSLYRGE